MMKRTIAAGLFAVALAGMLVAFAAPAFAVSVGQNFTASTFLSDSNFFPPDSDGAVGLSHYVELINGRYKVFQKSNGALVQNLSLANFWTNAGVTVSGGEADDPRVLWDPGSGRWFASSVDNPGLANSFLVAVSNTTDPTAGWQAFKIASDCSTTVSADFPTLGLNGDGVFMAANMFRISNGTLSRVNVLSIPKASLLAGNTANAKVISGVQATTGDTVQPVVSLNDTAMPELLISTANGTATISRVNGPLTGPTVTSVASVGVGPTTAPPDAAQKTISTLIDTGDGRLGACAVVQKGVIWATQAIDNNSLSAIRWYKIDANTHALLQTGVIRDATAAFYYPSIAVNGLGQAVIGFTASSPTEYAGSFAVVGSTVGGVTTFGAPIQLKAGAAPYVQTAGAGDTRNRWGDYSATNVDPQDPRHFWTIQEWASDNNIWSTQVTELISNFPLPGDANLDGIVDGTDLAIWQQNYDPLGTHLDNNTWDKGDWNGDDKIDGSDLALWQQNYAPLGYAVTGFSMPLGPDVFSSVPEPATLTLLGASAALLALRRRRASR